MTAEIRSIRQIPQDLSDLHGIIDEARSDGATGAILIMTFPGDAWQGWAISNLSAAERCFILQQIIMREVATAGASEEE